MIQLAYSSNSTQVNGLTIHKVQKGVLSQTFINDIIKNAGPNELFIIDDDPYTYVKWDNVDQRIVFKSMLQQFKYKEANCINKAEFIDDDQNQVHALKLSQLTPEILLEPQETVTEEKFLYYSNSNVGEHQVQQDLNWSKMQ